MDQWRDPRLERGFNLRPVFGGRINSSGQIIGDGRLANGHAAGFLYSQSVITALLPLGNDTDIDCRGINDSGQVVGKSVAPDYAMRPTGVCASLYSAGAMTDLNTLIDPSSGWFLNEVFAININGQIVGDGTINGAQHAFLLTPIPEPSSIVLGVLGLVAFAGWAWRRRVIGEF